MTRSAEKVISLKHSKFALKDSSEDIRGKKVVDRNSNEIGKVDDLFADEEEMKIRLVEVSSGGLLGIGDTKFILPVDAISRIDDSHVYVDRTREEIGRAPQYDPDVVNRQYLLSMYGYYGYLPYWGPGYLYPPYPHYIGQKKQERKPE